MGPGPEEGPPLQEEGNLHGVQRRPQEAGPEKLGQGRRHRASIGLRHGPGHHQQISALRPGDGEGVSQHKHQIDQGDSPGEARLGPPEEFLPDFGFAHIPSTSLIFFTYRRET